MVNVQCRLWYVRLNGLCLFCRVDTQYNRVDIAVTFSKLDPLSEFGNKKTTVWEIPFLVVLAATIKPTYK